MLGHFTIENIKYITRQNSSIINKIQTIQWNVLEYIRQSIRTCTIQKEIFKSSWTQILKPYIVENMPWWLLHSRQLYKVAKYCYKKYSITTITEMFTYYTWIIHVAGLRWNYVSLIFCQLAYFGSTQTWTLEMWRYSMWTCATIFLWGRLLRKCVSNHWLTWNKYSTQLSISCVCKQSHIQRYLPKPTMQF